MCPPRVAGFAEPDRWTRFSEGRRATHCAFGVVEASAKVERSFRLPQRGDELDTLFHALDALCLRRPLQSVGAHLGWLPAAIVKQDQPTAREHVQRSRHLGREGWMAERLGEMDRAEVDGA